MEFKESHNDTISKFFSSFNQDKIITDALFSDETPNYVSPSQPLCGNNVTITLRALNNNIDDAFIFIDDKKLQMTKSYSNDIFSYYTYVAKNIQKTLYYSFIVTKNDEFLFYNKLGAFSTEHQHYRFKIIPDFVIPSWAESAVMYQIYVDRFYNGDSSNDTLTHEYKYLGLPVKKKSWCDELTTKDTWDFYGGDLQGVIDKADYLSSLGVECIYFNPIFVSPSNHKYDISDYDYVDPHLGVIIDDYPDVLEFEKFHNDYAKMYMIRTTSKTNLEASNKLLAKLIDVFHSKNIKVILDGVFNHCGAFNKWLDTEGFYKKANYPLGAYQDEHSQYHDFFHWFGDSWKKDEYDGWWGYKNHPKLNFENSTELENYILYIAKKWVSPPFNADGWRLDVAADLGMSHEYNLAFWEKFRIAVKTANKDAIIIAEHYGDPTPWLDGKKWDTIMNYDAFMEPITWFLTGMEKHSEEFKADQLSNDLEFLNRMKYFMSCFSIQSLNTSMNQLSNHDHSRFLTRTNSFAGRLHTDGKLPADTNIKQYVMYMAITMQMTWVGSPTLYYGDEAGLTGFTDPDNRRPYPWGNENHDILNYYKLAINIHKENEALRYGSLCYIYSEYGILVYGRYTKNNKIIVIVNNTNDLRKLSLPVWKANVALSSKMKVLLRSKQDSYNTFNNKYCVNNGYMNISVNAGSSIILIEERG